MRKVLVVIMCMGLIFAGGNRVYGEIAYKESLAASSESVEQGLKLVGAKSFAVIECDTGKILFEKKSDEKRNVSHLTKLMTLLICAENIQEGKLKLSDKVTASAHANSMEGSQIWLDVGEKITVGELVKSITVGNANDACTALAEKIGKTEEQFVSLMNRKAESLGMKNTVFVDCTGIDKKNISTAEDMAKLCRELSKYKSMQKYMTTWLEKVRGGKAELVNLNRLVRYFPGITGMKACGSKESGDCVCASAKRGDMTVCAVALDCGSDEKRNKDAERLLQMSFMFYELYTPEIPKDMLKNIDVKGGEKAYSKVNAKSLAKTVIPKGSSGNIEVVCERKDMVEAPIKKGDEVGEFSCKLNDKTILKTEIVISDDVKKMNVKCGLRKILYNLFNMK